MHFTLHRLHSLLEELVVRQIFLFRLAYQAADVYFARFERELSGASGAGLFCDEFDTVLLLPLRSIIQENSASLRLRKMFEGIRVFASTCDVLVWD